MVHQTQYAAILFDLYNTLIAYSDNRSFYVSIAKDLDVPFDEWYAAYLALRHPSMRGHVHSMADRVAASCAAIGVQRLPSLIASSVDRYMPLFYEAITLFPETNPTLESVRSLGIPVGLVSNASSYSAPLLDLLGLRPFFNTVVLSCEIGVLKPEPAIYVTACTALGVDPQECLFIGDGEDDELEGAHRVGMTTIRVERGERRMHSDAKVLITVSDSDIHCVHFIDKKGEVHLYGKSVAVNVINGEVIHKD